MKRSVYLAAAFAVSLVASCTGGDSPTDASSLGNTALLAVVPVFPSGTSAAQADITRIRITVLSASDRSVLAVELFEVDPTATDWTLEFTTTIPSDPNVLLTIELISVVEGSEVVEFSGEIARTLGAGPVAVQNVTVARGPVDNFAVTSIVLEDPGSVLEGEGVQLQAVLQTSRSDADPQLQWTSADPTIATVTAEGFVDAVLPGTVSISVQAGRATDQIELVVDAQAVGLGFAVEPTETEVGDAISPAPEVEIVDARGDRVVSFDGQVSVELIQESSAALAEAAASNGAQASAALVLTGTTTVDATAGLAVFSDLTLDRTGQYLLRATSTDLTSADSDAFESFVAQADVGLTKVVDLETAFEGDVVRFTITALNNGPNDATVLTASDALPAGLGFVSATPTAGSYDAATGTWDIGALANGASAVLVLDATVAAGTAGQTIVNTATIESTDRLDDPANNTASASVEVSRAVADISIVKLADQSEVEEGSDVGYRIFLRNNGPDAATNIVVDEHFPTGLTFVNAEIGGGSLDLTSFEWTIPHLAAHGVATLFIKARAEVGTAGQTLTNTVSVRPLTAQEDDPANNDASASVSVVAPSVSTHRVYVSNTDDDDITFIDLKAGTSATYDCGGLGSCNNPRNLAVNHAGTLVAVPFRHSDEVGIFDPSVPGFVAVLTDASFDEPYAVAFTEDDKELWVANKKGGGSSVGSVSIVSLQTKTVVAELTDSEFESPEGIGITGGKAFVANRSGGTITILSVAGRSVLDDVSVGGDPRDVVGTPDGLWAYITSDSGYITKVRLSDGATTVIPMVSGWSRNIGMSPDGKKVYVATQNDAVNVVDVATDAVTEITFSTPSETYGVTILKDGSLGFVTENRSSGEVYMFDPKTGLEIAGGMFPLSVGRYPRGIAGH